MEQVTFQYSMHRQRVALPTVDLGALSIHATDASHAVPTHIGGWGGELNHEIVPCRAMRACVRSFMREVQL
jgi:hypothetical protein